MSNDTTIVKVISLKINQLMMNGNNNRMECN